MNVLSGTADPQIRDGCALQNGNETNKNGVLSRQARGKGYLEPATQRSSMPNALLKTQIINGCAFGSHFGWAAELCAHLDLP